MSDKSMDALTKEQQEYIRLSAANEAMYCKFRKLKRFNYG